MRRAEDRSPLRLDKWERLREIDGGHRSPVMMARLDAFPGAEAAGIFLEWNPEPAGANAGDLLADRSPRPEGAFRS